jgi:maltose/maltodextrin transport system permease protein
MQLAHAGSPARKKSKWWQSDVLKWLVIGLFSLVTCYLIVLMYAQGEYLFAILTLILVSAGLYVFANRRAYAWRYVYPGHRWHGAVCPVSADLHHRHRLYQLQQHQPAHL